MSDVERVACVCLCRYIDLLNWFTVVFTPPKGKPVNHRSSGTCRTLEPPSPSLAS